MVLEEHRRYNQDTPKNKKKDLGIRALYPRMDYKETTNQGETLFTPFMAKTSAIQLADLST